MVTGFFLEAADETSDVETLPSSAATLRSSYSDRFGCLPDIIVAAPGRVNLIGEHIDYHGYGVLPMAIEGSAVVAVGRPPSSTDEGVITVLNVDPNFSARWISSDPCAAMWTPGDTSVTGGPSDATSDWVHYVQAALKGVAEAGVRARKPVGPAALGGLSLLVSSTVPRAAGVSSSSALVVASAMAFAWSIGLRVTRSQLANICIDCERFVGTLGGGMDQSACCLAQRGKALFIAFEPLRVTPVALPEDAVFVIANSLVTSEKAVHAPYRYNKRVVESRLACLILARGLGIDGWESVRALKELEHRHGPLTTEVVMTHLRKGPYSRDDLVSALGGQQDLLALFADRADVAKLVLENNTEYYPRERALHIITEVSRVLRLKATLDQKGSLETLGALMDESHASCRDLYDCSADELDRLVDTCKAAGAVGSRLTGAGWGGCCVSLVRSEGVEQFLQRVRSEFYDRYKAGEIEGREQESYLFVTRPGPPAALWEVKHEGS